jgi:hypothetical protein
MEASCVVCGKKATKECGNCHKRFYCSEDCQISDWHRKHKYVCETSLKRVRSQEPFEDNFRNILKKYNIKEPLEISIDGLEKLLRLDDEDLSMSAIGELINLKKNWIVQNQNFEEQFKFIIDHNRYTYPATIQVARQWIKKIPKDIVWPSFTSEEGFRLFVRLWEEKININ